MAVYSAVVSLEQLLLNSDQLPEEELASLCEKMSSLKSSLGKIFPAPKRYRHEANKLANQIRDKIFEAQDKIESFIFFTQNHSPESPETHSPNSISLREITANIDPIIDEAKKLGDSIPERRKYKGLVDESQTFKASAINREAKIVGQEGYKADIEKKLTASTGDRLVIPISGMAGIGKTTLARSIYEDDEFMRNFPYKAWVTVALNDNIEEILRKLLDSVESRGQKARDNKYEGDVVSLKTHLHQVLSNKYLVVVDDLWDAEVWNRLKNALPDNENGSRILVTTRSKDLSDSIKSVEGLEMGLMGIENSWTLLRNRVFGNDGYCPENMEKIGREIAEHCKGIPLSLTLIGGLLSQESKEPEYWKSIEEDIGAATYGSDVELSYLRVLSLSYDLLPCQLRECFLYIAAFPEDSEIPVSKLIRLWVAEGFLTTPVNEKAGEQALQNLIDRSLVLILKNGSDGRVKYCGMHDVVRDVALEKSRTERFFHLRKRYSQKADDNQDLQRRVFVHDNILMCLEDVYNSTKTINKARSLLYVGPHHHHPMPLNLTFDLLRVFDALTFFFIRFPNEILKLIHLRYLSLTYNGKLPSRLSRLHKLQVLIVKRQPKVIYVGASFLPNEIWSMKELRHLLITETDLPLLMSPTEPGIVLLENLQNLSNVNADSCTQEVFDHVPNLKRLGMWMEEPKKVEFHMNKLDQLEIFKFIVLNPNLEPTPQVQPKFYFPNTVRKLSLSGTGLPWEEMEAIAALPNLQVLKLKELAFHGAEWCPTYVFEKLKFLLIEYLNLQMWGAESFVFPCLEQLILRHCYDLKELPWIQSGYLRLLELVDCSPMAVEWAEEIKNFSEDIGDTKLNVRIHSSWE